MDIEIFSAILLSSVLILGFAPLVSAAGHGGHEGSHSGGHSGYSGYDYGNYGNYYDYTNYGNGYAESGGRPYRYW